MFTIDKVDTKLPVESKDWSLRSSYSFTSPPTVKQVPERWKELVTACVGWYWHGPQPEAWMKVEGNTIQSLENQVANATHAGWTWSPSYLQQLEDYKLALNV